MRRTLWIAWALLLPFGLCAAELTPIVDGERIGARVHALALPDTLRKELRSGLTNRLLLRITLSDDTQVKASVLVEVALKYDLWDERFETQLLVDGVATAVPELLTVPDAMDWLGDLSLPQLFSRPDTTRALVLRVEALLNPIERERMERIRQWVKENSSSVPLDAGGRATTATSSSNAVFNEIFEQYAAGRDYASTWREELVSRPFDVNAR